MTYKEANKLLKNGELLVEYVFKYEGKIYGSGTIMPIPAKKRKDVDLIVKHGMRIFQDVITLNIEKIMFKKNRFDVMLEKAHKAYNKIVGKK